MNDQKLREAAFMTMSDIFDCMCKRFGFDPVEALARLQAYHTGHAPLLSSCPEQHNTEQPSKTGGDNACGS